MDFPYGDVNPEAFDRRLNSRRPSLSREAAKMVRVSDADLSGERRLIHQRKPNRQRGPERAL
jgi:hypothetical protein